MAPNPLNKTPEEITAQEQWVRLMQEAQMWSTVENGLKSWFHMCALTGRFAGAKPLSVDSLLRVTHHKLCLVLHPDKFWRPGDYDIDMRERTKCMAD